MWLLRRLASAALCFLLAGFAAATRGADSAGCTGVVIDENGVPLPAAQVTLQAGTGPTYHAETDGAGRFTIKSLPAGDYQIEVRKEGFFLLSGRTVTLQTGANEFTFTLNHAEELHTRVEVTAPANQIDPQDTSQRDTLTDRAIRDIPVANSHVLNESLVAMPEIVQDHLGSIHIAGARSGETQYMLDGFEIGDPVNNQLTSRFNIDATRAAEVQTGRFGAEYAHSGANVLSLETPDGDDKWRFGTTNPAPGINIQEGVHLGNWYPRFTFSGPIVRGRFWFSDAVSLQHTFAVVEELPRGANTSEQWAGDELLHLQFNVNPKHVVHGTFLYNRSYGTNLGLDTLDPVSTTVTGEQRRSFFALKDQVWLHDTLIDLGVAADTSTLDFTPQGSAPLVLLVNGSSGNYFDRSHQRGQRLQAVGSVTAASRHWHGTHTIAVGANVAGLSDSLTSLRGEIQALRAFQANGTTACTSATPDCLARQSTFAGPADIDLSNTQAGAYAQDTWALSKSLIVQAGLRADWDRFTKSGMAEPRFSGNILPFGDDRSKVSLGWGIYNAPLNLAVIGQTLDQHQLDTFFDTAGNILPPGPVVSQFVLPASGLRQPRFTISSVGWQQKFAHNTLFGLELLARNGYHGFAFVDQQPSQPGGIFLLQDHRKDRYRAATVSLRHVFSEDLEFYGAYTRSAAHSNQVFNPTLGSIFYTGQQPGPVAWDAPNRVVTWGWAPTHIWGILLTYFLEYRTGYPYSSFNLQQQIVGSANSLRFPDYASLNLGIEKKFGFRGYLWAVRVESINILGRENPDIVVSNVDAPNYGTFEGGQGRAFTLRVRFIGRK
ncbi:MAG TPA: carboxypeptidase regulatory-like domain-containing protein [Candidatus Methylomirabilis sp.]|nr:carboxypeptidase regulatory-like domain-containing protein [Candidatus Methylomirabilis sp.]